MNVLFVGATGLVGSQVVPFLKDDFNLTLAALHAAELEDLPVVAVDICNWEEIESLVQKGAANGEPFDAVVYCATADYKSTRHKDREDRRLYYENCIEVNARGAYHVFEAAWRADVPRVVHIGSLTAALGHPHYDYLDANAVDRPHDLYAATKIFGEHVGRSYVFRPRWFRDATEEVKTPMRVLCLRLGQPILSEKNWLDSRHLESRVPVYTEDIALAIERALLTEVCYGVYPIVSAVDNAWVDPELYAELGYKPAWKFSASESRLRKVNPTGELESQPISPARAG